MTVYQELGECLGATGRIEENEAMQSRAEKVFGVLRERVEQIERKEQENEDEEDDEEDTEPPTKRNRVRNKKTKLSKCPHCFREFTNLKHHINQQHAAVRHT